MVMERAWCWPSEARKLGAGTARADLSVRKIMTLLGFPSMDDGVVARREFKLLIDRDESGLLVVGQESEWKAQVEMVCAFLFPSKFPPYLPNTTNQN
jgi:hypothetical protein